MVIRFKPSLLALLCAFLHLSSDRALAEITSCDGEITALQNRFIKEYGLDSQIKLLTDFHQAMSPTERYQLMEIRRSIREKETYIHAMSEEGEQNAAAKAAQIKKLDHVKAGVIDTLDAILRFRPELAGAPKLDSGTGYKKGNTEYRLGWWNLYSNDANLQAAVKFPTPTDPLKILSSGTKSLEVRVLLEPFSSAPRLNFLICESNGKPWDMSCRSLYEVLHSKLTESCKLSKGAPSILTIDPAGRGAIPLPVMPMASPSPTETPVQKIEKKAPISSPMQPELCAAMRNKELANYTSLKHAWDKEHSDQLETLAEIDHEILEVHAAPLAKAMNDFLKTITPSEEALLKKAASLAKKIKPLEPADDQSRVLKKQLYEIGTALDGTIQPRLKVLAKKLEGKACRGEKEVRPEPVNCLTPKGFNDGWERILGSSMIDLAFGESNYLLRFRDVIRMSATKTAPSYEVDVTLNLSQLPLQPVDAKKIAARVKDEVAFKLAPPSRPTFENYLESKLPADCFHGKTTVTPKGVSGSIKKSVHQPTPIPTKKSGVAGKAQ